MKKYLILIAIGILVTNALHADDDHDEHEGKSSIQFARKIPDVSNASWKTECASCHMLYQPGLLPERSWTKMMNNLEQHFGENAALDDKTKKEITDFLVSNASDKSYSRRGQKILKTINANETPLRISETRYFIRKHDEVSPETYKRKAIGSPANCIACHSNAERGDFSEENVRIPKASETPKTIKSSEYNQVVDSYLASNSK